MKLSSIVCASLLALALTAQGASAVTTTSSSKSNGSDKTTVDSSKSNTFKIGTAAGTTEADCTKADGKVTTDKDGMKWCTDMNKHLSNH